MTLTVADASRSYRQRRAEKVARMEAALEWIVLHSNDSRNLSLIAMRARQALNPGKEMGE